MAAAKKIAGATDAVTINAPSMGIARILIRGLTNYVCNSFPEEARNQMMRDQMAGSVDKVRGGAKKRPPKDFDAGYRGSMHVSTEGWHGIPVIAIRSAMVRAARLCGIEMTAAKMCVFVEADGFDKDGKGLVRITRGEPERFDSYVRNDNGSADIRARARFAPGWEAMVTLQFDSEFMSGTSAVNLLHRAGLQVGIGAGRPFSTNSVGQGWGTFEIAERESAAAE
jgi:hypothetical protein